MKIRNLLLIVLFFLLFIICFNNSNYSKVISMNQNSSISLFSYQNDTIQYPIWSKGIYYHTYDQYGQLQILPFEIEGSWISEIYTENTFYFYNWITICEISALASIDLIIYVNFEGSGWIPVSVPLNYTYNTLFNGNWEFYFQFNLSKGIGELSPVIFNFTFYYLRDILETIEPISLSNPIFELTLIFIVLIILFLIYLKLRSISLMTIVYMFFMVIVGISFLDLTIPFYPFIQLFCLSLGSYLFVDMILDYKKQKEN